MKLEMYLFKADNIKDSYAWGDNDDAEHYLSKLNIDRDSFLFTMQIVDENIPGDNFKFLWFLLWGE